MKLLLDTHVWLWWLNAPDRLTTETLEAISNELNDVFLSAASSWEIAIKVAVGKLQLAEDPESFVVSRLLRDGISGLSITHGHALAAGALPNHHRDPFDRMLVAQARTENLVLLTADPLMKPYEVRLMWTTT
jgi:PIN domain nuclease of toxin-antitoxin system